MTTAPHLAENPGTGPVPICRGSGSLRYGEPKSFDPIEDEAFLVGRDPLTAANLRTDKPFPRWAQCDFCHHTVALRDTDVTLLRHRRDGSSALFDPSRPLDDDVTGRPKRVRKVPAGGGVVLR